ncbi:MAG: hypothetical protein F6K54_28005 [Okeania sp. SIO3B5]|uniref:hypothetical protein n=1 Tax=Okeania sp. SIO3B5 TaxID=2607811 RepID=UPI0013FFCC55|nr:hypothetical protein [Okeania sp. SIO3B5]NEO56582.1 hypothetical protein [Okeania sp. SIO3B5]
MGKLKNTLSGNLNTKIDIDKQNHPVFGIDIDIGAVGITLSTEDGGTAGIKLGLGVEYNVQGGGSVDILGVYKMEVEKSGCVYVKDFYAGGFYTHTEVELIPNCDIEEKEPPELDKDASGMAEDIKSNFPDNQFGSDSFPGDPDDVLVGVAVWNATEFAYAAYNPDGSKVRDSGIGHDIIEQVSEPVVTGEGYLRFYSVELKRSYFRGWAVLDYFIPFLHTGFPEWFTGAQFTDLSPFLGTELAWYYVTHPPMEAPSVHTIFQEDLVLLIEQTTLPFRLFETGKPYLFKAKRRVLNAARGLVADFYSEARDNSLHRRLRKPENEPEWSAGFTSWRLDYLGVYNLTQGFPDGQSHKPPPEPIKLPGEPDMSKKCCFTEDDRKRAKLTLLNTGGFGFPGKIGINDNTLSAKFPVEEGETLQKWESPISSLLELHIWRILNNSPADSELTRKIALSLGVPVEKFKVNEQYPDGIKEQSSPEDYGFPFKVSRSWTEPDKKGGMTIYNLKHLSLILGNLLAEIHQALRPNELLTEGVEYPNQWIAPRGKGTSKASNYLQLFEVLSKMLDHLGIHPCEPTLADLNPAQPGQQSWGIKVNNATHAMKLVLEFIKETDGDQAAALNLNLRESILLGQMFTMVASIYLDGKTTHKMDRPASPAARQRGRATVYPLSFIF